MQFVAKTKSMPYKAEDEYVPSEFEILPDSKIKVSEIIKKNVYLDKTQFKNAIKAMEEKLGFYQYQISDHRISVIKKDIEVLMNHIASYKAALIKLEKSK